MVFRAVKAVGTPVRPGPALEALPPAPPTSLDQNLHRPGVPGAGLDDRRQGRQVQLRAPGEQVIHGDRRRPAGPGRHDLPGDLAGVTTGEGASPLVVQVLPGARPEHDRVRMCDPRWPAGHGPARVLAGRHGNLAESSYPWTGSGGPGSSPHTVHATAPFLTMVAPRC